MTYGECVSDKAMSDRGLFERAAMYLPGYRGYRTKNIRREVDKEVRREVTRSLAGAKADLANISKLALEGGDVRLGKDVERVRTKTDTYLKKIESAESGYSGLWEDVKTLDSELKAVVEWDADLLEGAAGLRERTGAILAAMDRGDAGAAPQVREVERAVDALFEGLAERIKVLKGLGNGTVGDERWPPTREPT